MLTTRATAVASVVVKFLADNPSFRLLRLDDVRDIVEPVGEQKFSPFVRADMTGDRIPDLAAVLVQRSSPERYGVVAFNGSRADSDKRARWIVNPQEERIVGVYVEERRRMDIAYCLECDDNPFARWNGVAYEMYLSVPGDTPATFDVPSKGSKPVTL